VSAVLIIQHAERMRRIILSSVACPALPAARQTPNLEDQWLDRSNSRHQVFLSLKRRERTPAAEGGTMGEKFAENFAESCDFHVTFGFFYMP
jgi:hypothetical protein